MSQQARESLAVTGGGTKTARPGTNKTRIVGAGGVAQRDAFGNSERSGVNLPRGGSMAGLGNEPGGGWWTELGEKEGERGWRGQLGVKLGCRRKTGPGGETNRPRGPGAFKLEAS